jgi:hypothetical protein
MDKETFSNFQRGKIQDSKLHKGVCCICGESDSRVLKEHHHIFGRAIGKETILLCRNCHEKITHEQNSTAPKERSKKSNDSKIPYSLKTQGALLELVGKKLKEFSSELKKCQKRR